MSDIIKYPIKSILLIGKRKRCNIVNAHHTYFALLLKGIKEILFFHHAKAVCPWIRV